MECTCFEVDPKYWTTHYGAVEPGSTMEHNPDCPVHGTPAPKVMLGFDGASLDDFVTVGVEDNGILFTPDHTDIDWLQAKQRIEPVNMDVKFERAELPLWVQPEPQEFSISVSYHEPTIQPKLRKGDHGMVGKEWRKYCRAYRRDLQAWKKAGKPTREGTFYFPRASVMIDKISENLVHFGTAAQGMSVNIRAFADAFAMHPSNWGRDG